MEGIGVKNFWVRGIVIGLIFINFFILFGCSNERELNALRAPKTQDEENNKNAPYENFIKRYYEGETTKDEGYLKKFFVNPEAADIKSIKQKFLSFGIGKIDYTGIYNVKTKGRLAIMVSTFNALFKDIKKSRPDIEIVILINSNNSWYFLNDNSGLNEEEVNWLNSETDAENKFIVENKKIQSKLKANKQFDEENRDYMDKSREKFLQQQNNK